MSVAVREAFTFIIENFIDKDSSQRVESIHTDTTVYI
jgi:hypothetical protein